MANEDKLFRRLTLTHQIDGHRQMLIQWSFIPLIFFDNLNM